MHLINLSCQSASFKMTFMLERHFLHSQITCALSCLHRVGWSCVRSDNPAISACLSLVAVGWSDLTPDDPDLGFVSVCQPLSEAGWSGLMPVDPALEVLRVCFCLFCYPLGWFSVCPDDPVPPGNTHNGGSIYTPSPPSFTSLYLHDQPHLPSIHSLSLRHPRAWFMQGLF